MVIDIKGDLLETECKTIAHGVNCQGVMGSGVAKVLTDKYPEVRESYFEYYNLCEQDVDKYGTDILLGMVEGVSVDGGKRVLNCFTQNKVGYDGRKYVSYDAIHNCFRRIAVGYDEIAIPRIGCGLAGGSWDIVKPIIEHAVGDRCKVYAYYLEDTDDKKS